MKTKKVKHKFSIQRRVLEIGMISRIAHNMARYSVMDDAPYTSASFSYAVRQYMRQRGMEKEDIIRIMYAAENQANREVQFFMENGTFPDSSGGTYITVEALIGEVLNELGYR